MDCRAVRVSVSGTEDVMATNNGDPTDQTAYPSITRRLFAGRALTLIRCWSGAHARTVIDAMADGGTAARLELVVGAAVDAPRGRHRDRIMSRAST